MQFKQNQFAEHRVVGFMVDFYVLAVLLLNPNISLKHEARSK